MALSTLINFLKKHKKSNNSIFGAVAFLLFFAFFIVRSVFGFSSANFELENPVNVIGGGESSSSSFQYISTFGQLLSGQSTSSQFSQNAGFLYFPTASSPVISATAGSSQATVTWTAAVGTFANVTDYHLGISTSSTGPYTYSSVGNVLTSTRTGLINSTTYFFKVRSYADGVLLSESAFVSATPTGSVAPSGGGGGGGASATNGTGITFTGRAYPLSRVTILKDGQPAITTIAGPDAMFTVTVGSLSTGAYNFSVYSTDSNGRQSTLFTFPITFTSGTSTQVGGIFLAPTISVDKSEVKKGDTIAIFGQSAPLANVTISVHSAQELFRQTQTDANGVYLYNFDTVPLEIGRHDTKSKADVNNSITQYGKILSFTVGNQNIPIDDTVVGKSKADLNSDGRINIVDFSIMAFWYKKNGFPDSINLNADAKIDLIDFSILAYNWTG